MNPTLISTILLLIQELVKVVPPLAAEIVKILQSPNPTAADWAALRARVKAKKYEDYTS